MCYLLSPTAFPEGKQTEPEGKQSKTRSHSLRIRMQTLHYSQPMMICVNVFTVALSGTSTQISDG